MVDRVMASGGEIVATRVATSLDPERFESILCATRRSDPGELERVAESGIRVLELARRSRFDIAAWTPLLRLLQRERPEVLHAHKFGSNVWAALLGRTCGVPVVVAHEHTWSYTGKPLRRLLDRRLVAPAVDAFLSVSEEDRRRMIEIEHVDPAKLRYLPNGIPDLAPGDGQKLRRSLGIGSGAPVVGTVCALRPQKALEVLLEAGARLLRAFPDLTILVAGEGPERARLERTAAELGIAASVRFLGPQPHDRVADVLDALDVAVLSSDFEGMPVAVIEFMAAAKPIVATRVGGVPALVDDGVHGLLVPPRDPPRLADAVGTLLRDPRLGERLGTEARTRQQRQFRLETMVRRLELLYECLYACSARGRAEAATGRRPASREASDALA